MTMSEKENRFPVYHQWGKLKFNLYGITLTVRDNLLTVSGGISQSNSMEAG